MEVTPNTPRTFGYESRLTDDNTPSIFRDQPTPAINQLCGGPNVNVENNTPVAARDQESSAENDTPTEANSALSFDQDDQTQETKRKSRLRGRAPKDPLGQTVNFDVLSLEDLQATLRDYLKDPTAPSAEHTTVVFTFPVSAAFMIYNKPANKLHEATLYGTLSKVAISVMEALRTTMDPREQLEKQRAIAKVCAESVMAADGFKYQFNNNWISKEDNASRFSYFCNDSPLNKGRAINEGAGSAGKKRRKEVYECNGMLHVKFSVKKNNLEVHYRHIPIHSTYAERAPPPRPESKRRKLMEIFNPELLPKPREKKAKPTPIPIQLNNEATSEHRIPLDPTRDNSPLPNIDDPEDQPGDTNSRAAPVPFSVEKLADFREPETPKPQVPRTRASIHSTIQGRMGEEGDFVWKAKDPDKLQRRKSKTVPLGPLTEVDTLKAKLEETEKRLQELEAGRLALPASYPVPYPGPYPPYPYPPLYHCPYPYPQGQPPYPPTGHWPPHPPQQLRPGMPQGPPPLQPQSPHHSGAPLQVQKPAGPGPKPRKYITHNGPAQAGPWQPLAPIPGHPHPLGPGQPNPPKPDSTAATERDPSSTSVGAEGSVLASVREASAAQRPSEKGAVHSAGQEGELLRSIVGAAAGKHPSPSGKEVAQETMLEKARPDEASNEMEPSPQREKSAAAGDSCGTAFLTERPQTQP